MNEMISLFRGALTLNPQTFIDLKASPQVFRKGFMFLMLVGLIVGLVLGLVGMVTGLFSDPAKDIASTRQQIRDGVLQFMSPSQASAFLESFDMGMNIAERIMREVKTPLPRPFSVIFTNLGVIVSRPFSWLGSLLLYGAIVHIFARLLGGRGSIAQMLGLTSLTVAPRIVEALGFIPCIGSLLGFVGWVWSIIIYVKATQSAQDMTMGKTILAVFAPVIIALLLAIIGFVIFVVLISRSSGG